MKGLLLATVVGAVAVCAPAAAPPLRRDPLLLPQPHTWRTNDSPDFTLRSNTRILHGAGDAEARAAALRIADILHTLTGLTLPVSERSDDDEAGNAILLDVDAEVADAGPEGYEMSCDDQLVAIVSASPAGLLYGTESFLFLLARHPATNAAVWTAPGCDVHDSPRFRWRGLHVTAPVSDDTLARLVDVMPLFKLNVLSFPASATQLTNSAPLEARASARAVKLMPYPDSTNLGSGTPVLFISPEPPKSAVRYSRQEPARTLLPFRAIPLDTNRWSVAAGLGNSADAPVADALCRVGCDVIVNEEHPDPAHPTGKARVLGGLIPWTGTTNAGTNFLGTLSVLSVSADFLWRPATVGDAPVSPSFSDATNRRLETTGR